VRRRKRIRYSERKGRILGSIRVMMVSGVSLNKIEKIVDKNSGIIVIIISIIIIGIRLVIRV